MRFTVSSADGIGYRLFTSCNQHKMQFGKTKNKLVLAGCNNELISRKFVGTGRHVVQVSCKST